MPTTIPVPTAQATCLHETLDAVRGETQVLKTAGLLSVSADDLLDGGGTGLGDWMGDLAVAVEDASGATVLLPVRDPGMLQHIVYGMSAVLVWANELRTEGRLATTIPTEAVAAWSEIERVAGLGGRTAMAMGYESGRLTGAPDLRVETIQETAATAAA